MEICGGEALRCEGVKASIVKVDWEKRVLIIYYFYRIVRTCVSLRGSENKVEKNQESLCECELCIYILMGSKISAKNEDKSFPKPAFTTSFLNPMM